MEALGKLTETLDWSRVSQRPVPSGYWQYIRRHAQYLLVLWPIFDIVLRIKSTENAQ